MNWQFASKCAAIKKDEKPDTLFMWTSRMNRFQHLLDGTLRSNNSGFEMTQVLSKRPSLEYLAGKNWTGILNLIRNGNFSLQKT